MSYSGEIQRGVFAALSAQANTTITTGGTYYNFTTSIKHFFGYGI